MILFYVALVAMVFFFFNRQAYAGGVTDDNNGAKGQVLVSTGDNNGANSEGHWTNSSFLKGADGQNGTNGSDGKDGLRGNDGVSGNDGTDGKDGINGQSGTNGTDGRNGVNGDDGKEGQQGKDGKDVDGKALSRLKQTKYIAGVEVRLWDTKRTAGYFMDYYDVRANHNFMIGGKVVIKLGTSYEEREVIKTNARLDRLERQALTSGIVEKVYNSKGELQSLHYSER